MTATIEILGGLGNQLFQLFALIAYSLRTKTPFFFENKPITCGDRKKYYWNTPLLNKLKGFIRPPLQQQLIYKEPFFHYTPIPQIHPNSQINNIKLHGYFQSEKYFLDYKDIIFRMLNLKETQQSMKEKVAPYLPTSAFENIVSLHFRVGDYATMQNAHPLMPIEYYEKALEQLLKDTNGKKDWFILYFCEENDIEYVNEKINVLKQNANFQDFVFLKVPQHLDDWEQMLTMSLCQHHIIANSTFSWWGAYFGGGKGSGNVYYPSKWFGPALGDKKTDDLCLESWKKISV